MELTIDQALQKAIEAHKAGQVQEADRLYTAILKAHPKHPDANHNIGVLAVGVGKVQEALAFFKTALEANPSITQFWLSYIDALIKLERLHDARAVFDQAKAKGAKGDGFDRLEKSLKSIKQSTSPAVKNEDPPQDQLQSLINLYSQGEYKKVLDRSSILLEQFPNSAILYNIKGVASKDLGELNTAIFCLENAIRIKPEYANAYNNLGISLQEQDKAQKAIEAYDR